jgi:hypothetical protein
VKKKQINGTFLYSFLIFLFYFILFPLGTGKDSVVQPVKKFNLHDEIESGAAYSNTDETTWFRIGDTFGFIDKRSNLLYKSTIDYDIALSNTGFIKYSSIQEGDQGFVYCNVRGEVRSSLRYPGYPILSRDGKRIFVIKTDGTGLREVSQDGDQQWIVSFASIITSLSVRDEFALLGLLGGSVKLYNREGKCLYSVMLKDSKTESVYGCALSKNENEIAAVYGVQPQRIVIVKMGSSSLGKPESKDTDTDFRKPVYIEFSDDGELLFVEGEGKVIVMDTESLSLRTIPVTGTFQSMSLADGASHAVVVTRLTGERIPSAGIYVVVPPDILLAKEYFSGAEVSARLFGKFLIVGVDDELAIFEVREA